ncbi:MAG: thiamine-phosphate kinase [Rickettsiales bacterium]|nr:thiamine-phosphate kinase [Rickettsiales bacterium]
MNEFDAIATFFAPLAEGYDGALGLKDDAAIFFLNHETAMVATKDAISEGVHFLGSEDAGLIAKKLLRSNLSDIAAMGAVPAFYLLALMLPAATPSAWIEAFSKGLWEDQQHYGIRLAGGDTIATKGPFSASLTALGTVPYGKALLRRDAKAGDRIYVSGSLGDSALGLAVLQGRLEVSDYGQALALKERYFLPQPRMQLGQALVGLAHACMDVSDGLVQDLGHICAASGVGAVIHQKLLPLSEAAREVIEADDAWWRAPLSGGDDYELLFTVPQARHAEVGALSLALGLPLTAIGEIVAGDGVRVLDAHGMDATPAHKGYSHSV